MYNKNDTIFSDTHVTSLDSGVVSSRKYLLEQYGIAQGPEYLLPKQFDALNPYGSS